MPVCNDEAMKTKESSIGDNAPFLPNVQTAND